MKCEQCSTPLGTPSKCPETKRRVQKEPGPDSAVSWVVAFAAFMINFIMAGLSRMSGILYVEFIHMFDIDRQGASMPFSVRSSTMNLLGPVVGILGQKYGVRKVSVIGGVLGVLSAAGCFFADDIVWITIIWGGLNGAGTALVTTLTTVVIAQYFDVYKTTASGISFSGACIGSFVFPPLIEYLLEDYGLGGSFLIIAGIIMHTLPAAMILHKPVWIKKANREAEESERKRRLEKSCSSLARSIAQPEANRTDAVDLNYLRSNSDLVVKLFTIGCASKDEKAVVYPPKEDILREMEDMYALVGKTSFSPILSEVQSKIDAIKAYDVPLGDPNGNFQSPNRLSAGEYQHTPVRKVKSAQGSLQTSKCKPFIVYKLKELYNKTDQQMMFSLSEKNLYARALGELRKLHRMYETVIKRNIFSKSRPLIPRNSVPKMAPKTLIPDPQRVPPPAQNSICDSFKNSMRLHTKPLFLLIALCRAVHFSTFIPAVTIIVDYAMDKGMMEEDGKYILAAMSVGDLLGRLCFGWVTDKGYISLARYMLVVMVIQGMSTAALPMMNTMTTLLPTICFYALLQGSVFVRHSVLISKYMRSDEQSIASGCVNFFAGLLGFAVPSYVGFFRDTMGSYDTIFYLNGAAGALTGLLWIFEPCFVKLSSDIPKFSKVEKV